MEDRRTSVDSDDARERRRNEALIRWSVRLVALMVISAVLLVALQWWLEG